MAKKVTIKAKPTKRPAVTADEWVAGGRPAESAPETSAPAPKPDKPPTTRYTIDIPTTLHAQIKIKCAQKGVRMNEEITRLLEKHFGD